MTDRPNYLKRYSCRRYRTDPVSEDIMQKLIDAALSAPSAGNLQPWRLYVITSGNIREALAGAAYGQRFVAEAPVVFAVCAVPGEAEKRYGIRGRDLYCIQDTAALVENLLLAAQDHSLGSCWVGAFQEEEVRKVLSVPDGWRPVALVPVGYPGEPAAARIRKRQEDVVRYV